MDITRLPRSERRKIVRQIHQVIPGRNLPYVKAIHGSVKLYNQQRDKEIIIEQKQHEHTKTNQAG